MDPGHSLARISVDDREALVRALGVDRNPQPAREEALDYIPWQLTPPSVVGRWRGEYAALPAAGHREPSVPGLPERQVDASAHPARDRLGARPNVGTSRPFLTSCCRRPPSVGTGAQAASEGSLDRGDTPDWGPWLVAVEGDAEPGSLGGGLHAGAAPSLQDRRDVVIGGLPTRTGAPRSGRWSPCDTSASTSTSRLVRFGVRPGRRAGPRGRPRFAPRSRSRRATIVTPAVRRAPAARPGRGGPSPSSRRQASAACQPICIRGPRRARTRPTGCRVQLGRVGGGLLEAGLPPPGKLADHPRRLGTAAHQAGHDRVSRATASKSPSSQAISPLATATGARCWSSLPTPERSSASSSRRR